MPTMNVVKSLMLYTLFLLCSTAIKDVYNCAFKKFCDLVVEPVVIEQKIPESLKNLLVKQRAAG